LKKIKPISFAQANGMPFYKTKQISFAGLENFRGTGSAKSCSLILLCLLPITYIEFGVITRVDYT